MLEGKKVAVVVPVYNEETQIRSVVDTMPDFVDRIVIVNDCSTDGTAKVLEDMLGEIKSGAESTTADTSSEKDSGFNYAEQVASNLVKKETDYNQDCTVSESADPDHRILVLTHKKNGGVGAAIATGYKWCFQNHIDCTAVMAGDGQMDPSELEKICMPVVRGEVDYVKGNRLIHRSAWLVMPKVRYIGNSVLSILTKVASGYWHVSDTQTGYTAISHDALRSIRIHKIYKDYGMPNDILVKLNISFCTLKEVEIKPVYNVGEQSKMKIWKVIPKVSTLLFKSFFKRLWAKYCFRDFHPLFLFYNFSFFLGIVSCFFGWKIGTSLFFGTEILDSTIMAFAFFFTTAFQSLLFAMWMDIQDNERLYH